MGRRAKHIRLIPEQDNQLCALEQQSGIHPKVRLRAQVVRLSVKGWTIPGWPSMSVATPRASARTYGAGSARRLLAWPMVLPQAKLPSLPQRWRGSYTRNWRGAWTWNCTTLAEALAKSFGVRIGWEALRLRLRALGYRWKRTRYMPKQKPDPEAEATACQELAALSGQLCPVQ